MELSDFINGFVLLCGNSQIISVLCMCVNQPLGNTVIYMLHLFCLVLHFAILPTIYTFNYERENQLFLRIHKGYLNENLHSDSNGKPAFRS